MTGSLDPTLQWLLPEIRHTRQAANNNVVIDPFRLLFVFLLPN